MDSLSALSLAASVVQFIDFGTRLVCKTKEFADNGSLISHRNLTSITANLMSISSSMRSQIDGRGGQNLQPSDVDKVGPSLTFHI